MNKTVTFGLDAIELLLSKHLKGAFNQTSLPAVILDPCIFHRKKVSENQEEVFPLATAVVHIADIPGTTSLTLLQVQEVIRDVLATDRKVAGVEVKTEAATDCDGQTVPTFMKISGFKVALD